MNIEDLSKSALEKVNNEKDIIRKIIKLKVIDVINGNNRDSLVYVDVLYPAIEALFGLDVCLDAISNKDVLKDVLEQKYNADIDYDTLKSYFESAVRICERTNDEQRMLNINDDVNNAMKTVIQRLSKIYNTRKKLDT